ncbi:MAG: DUF305 domain-containing protein, partial [Solirubrobacteraceae bacterium]
DDDREGHMRIVRALAVVLALLAAPSVLAGCGDDDSGGGGAGVATGSGNPVDRAFVGEMVPHHESAIEMAAIAQRRASGGFVKQLADDIARTQQAEIATMRAADRRIAAGGVRRGSLGVPEHMMGMDGAVASLMTAQPFDAAFVRMMIPHHEGALVMAKAELERGEDPELKQLARDILAAQELEIAAMRKHLGEARAEHTDAAEYAG